MSESQTGLIYRKIPEVMGKLGSIEKGRKNSEQGYAFRGIDDVHNALQRLLAECGVFYTPEVLEADTVERQRANGKVSFHTFMRVRFTFYAADGSSVSSITRGEGMDHGSDKGSNKAMSAAEKYALLQVFCVPTVEQADSDRESPNVNTGVVPAQRATPPAPVAKPTAPPAESVVKKAFAAWCGLNKEDLREGWRTFARAHEMDPDKMGPEEINAVSQLLVTYQRDGQKFADVTQPLEVA